MSTDTARPRHISVADTAKLVRASLKAKWPTIKFAVRSKSYSGGASITIYWTDGPTTKEVEAVANRYEGATFDGMVDLKSHHSSNLNGERVHFGADFIFTSRSYSVAFLQRRAETVQHKYGGELVQVTVNRWGSIELVGGDEPWGSGRFTYQDMVYQQAYRTRGPIPAK